MYFILFFFRSVKHYFFLDAGDFILHFMSLCGAELVKNVDDVIVPVAVVVVVVVVVIGAVVVVVVTVVCVVVFVVVA